MCETKINCSCSEAMETAYTALKEKNISAEWAISAAVKIYQYHHPEVTVVTAKRETTRLLEGITAS